MTWRTGFVLGMLAAGPARAQETHLLIVTGLGGEPSYSESFYDWGAALYDAAAGRFEIPRTSIRFLAEDPTRDPVRIHDRSTRDNIIREIDSLAARTRPGDQVLIMLVGHGSARDEVTRFNVAGPDMTGEELGAALAGLAGRTTVVVNAFSSSGWLVGGLSGEGRVIITATGAGTERNATRFPEYFVQAFTESGADQDRDNRVSMLEAFQYAAREVERFYESGTRLRTEHALLDDNGDGQGSREPDPVAGDGSLARRVFLASGGRTVLAGSSDDPAIAALYREKAAIEQRLQELRTRADSMDRARYESELEDLLVELALKTREIRRLEGDGS